MIESSKELEEANALAAIISYPFDHEGRVQMVPLIRSGLGPWGIEGGFCWPDRPHIVVHIRFTETDGVTAVDLVTTRYQTFEGIVQDGWRVDPRPGTVEERDD